MRDAANPLQPPGNPNRRREPMIQRKTDLSDLFDAVRTCDLRAILEARGHKFKKDNFFETNPLRQERTTSIHIPSNDPSRYFDFGPNEGGDLIDFLQSAENLTLQEARHQAATLLGIDITTPSRKASKPPVSTPATTTATNSNINPAATSTPAASKHDYTTLATQAHEALWAGESPEAQRALEYLKSRGFSADSVALRIAKLGVIDATVPLTPDWAPTTWRGRIVIPYTSQTGHVHFLNARQPSHDAPQNQRYRKPTGARQTTPYTIGTLPGSIVILVEGELDALAIYEAMGDEYSVVATGGGKLRDEHIPLLKEAARVYVLFDSDESGQGFAQNAQLQLEAEKITVGQLTLKDAKDPCELLATRGKAALRDTLQQQIQDAQSDGDLIYVRTDFLDELERRHARTFFAYSTGIPELDRLLDGGYQEGLHVLGGLTGGGKTSFAVRLALENARHERTVIYATFEQSKLELWARVISAATQIPYRAIKRGTYEKHGVPHSVAQELTQSDKWPHVLHASQYLHVLEAGDAFSNRQGTATIDSIHTLADRLKRETGTPPLVIIDYIQRVPVTTETVRDVRERVDHVVGQLQVAIAREVGSPILALSSINRAGYGRNGDKATLEEKLATLKESGGIEFTAYTVALLYPDKEPSMPSLTGTFDSSRTMCFDLLKNREGAIGEVRVRWSPIGDKWTPDVTTPKRR
jgi:replicative DNA helicase